jgi:O-methyltransferase involved in polyketide biosynthesis
MPISDDDRKALEEFQLAARLSGLDVELVEPHYKQFDFAAHLEQWMTEHGFSATPKASFVDLLNELSAQVSQRPRN